MDFISEIIGCNLQYNYQPRNASVMELVEQNLDIVACAKHCLDTRAKCQHGWVYHAGNRKVGKIYLSVTVYVIQLLIVLRTD